MKSAKSIIEHLLHQPQNSKILQMACFEKVKSMLPAHLQAAIMFIYKKNNTLFFVLNHPGMKMEFHYKHTLIKTLLNKLQELDSNCQELDIKEVKSFVSNKIPPAKPTEKKEPRYFVEKSKGAFDNHAKDPKLQALFEEIRGLLS